MKRLMLLFAPLLLSGCVANLKPRICTTGISMCPPGVCAQVSADTQVVPPPGWCGNDGKERVPIVDLKQAAQMMRLCFLSYGPDDSIRALGSVTIDSVDCGPLPHISGNKWFIWYDTVGAVKRQVVALRGTANFENLFQDFYYPKKFDAVISDWVHGGIYDAVMKVEPLVKARLVPGVRVCLTGHSLGGAMASLLALHFYKSGMNMGPLFTFAQPQVFCETTVLAYRCFPVIRFINEDDPVPYVPPTMAMPSNPSDSLNPGFHGTFRQLGDEAVLHAKGGYVYRCTHDQYRNGRLYAKRIWKAICAKDYKALLPAHMQDVYLARMNRIAAGVP
ncbi:MAG TPA: lipase family protein [Chitinivibrionales bacterium]|nr:lipase family protein [Chitinivibrionales bacterium]